MAVLTDLFADPLIWAEGQLSLVERQQISRVGSGTPYSRESHDPIFGGKYRTVPLEMPVLRVMLAKLRNRRGVLDTLLCHDMGQPYPASSPLGAFTETNLKIKAIDSGTRATIALKGLPAGFVLTIGDYFVIIRSDGGRSLHQVQASVTADGSGDTAQFAIYPHRLAATVADQVVSLKRPAMVAVIEPGTLGQPENVGGLFFELSFSVVQVP